jgi:hypothetical protein
MAAGGAFAFAVAMPVDGALQVDDVEVKRVSEQDQGNQ